ncbi:MAG: hypothetical protein QMD65_01870 [Patescibacteria group bacterium]|nr:hypothetical protein [Patescibacteria group bacterium]
MKVTREDVVSLLRFYEGLEKPLTSLEILRLLSNKKTDLLEIENILEELIQKKLIQSEDGFYFLAQAEINGLKRRRQDLLLDTKWKKFLKARILFSCIPFLQFVLGAGSLALGNVNSDSDFDVVIGCKKMRIFTVRFFCILFFGMFGIRRKRIDHKENARDKICLNHFVTSKSYKLTPPYHKQWEELYKNIVPVYGDEKEIKIFFEANNWFGGRTELNDKRFKAKKNNVISKFLELLFFGSLGDVFELLVKKLQIVRIKRSLGIEKANLSARLKFDDEELEFHPDIAKIEALLEKTGF